MSQQTSTNQQHGQQQPVVGARAIMNQSIKVGAVTGGVGMLVGAAIGTLRAEQPVVSMLRFGLPMFGHGTIFYGSRTAIINKRHGPEAQLTSGQKIEASALSGAVTGTMWGLLVRPKYTIQTALAISLLAAEGQYLVNKFGGQPEQPAQAGPVNGKETSNTSWLDSKWMPIRRISDQEYEDILQEKLLRLEAEIAIVDESIAALKAQKAEEMQTTPETFK